MYYHYGFIVGSTLLGFITGVYAKQIMRAFAKLKFNRKPTSNDLIERISSLENKLNNREKNVTQTIRKEVNEYLNNLKK